MATPSDSEKASFFTLPFENLAEEIRNVPQRWRRFRGRMDGRGTWQDQLLAALEIFSDPTD